MRASLSCHGKNSWVRPFCGADATLRATVRGNRRRSDRGLPHCPLFAPARVSVGESSRKAHEFSLSGNVAPPYTSGCWFPLSGWDRIIRNDTVRLERHRHDDSAQDVSLCGKCGHGRCDFLVNCSPGPRRVDTGNSAAACRAGSPNQQAVPATDADQSQDPMQQYLREQQAAREALEPLRKNAPYQEVEPISLPNGRKILGFTALCNNELAVISGKASEYGAVNALIQAFTKPTPNELIWLDAEGQVIRIVPLSFLPAAVNVAADGTVFVVGDGKIAQFSADGKLVADVESPHSAAILKDRARLENDIKARREEELKSLRDSVTATEEAMKVLQEKPEEQRSEEEKSELEMYKQSAASLKMYVEQQEKQPLEEYIEAALSGFRQVHRVAASDKELFIVTRQIGGYGFAVWRMNRDFTDAKQIIDGLAGCCGQMDVQVHNETVFVAENARHRVGQYDRDGNQVTSLAAPLVTMS